MFWSRKKNRRRDRSNRAHSRRLGVELMERRMMLSATGFDAPQPGLDVTQVNFSPAQISLTGAHIAFVSQATDGGYVDSDTLTLAGDTIGWHGTSVAGNISLDYGVAGQDLNVLPAQLYTNGSGYTISRGYGIYGEQFSNAQWQTDYLILSGPGVQLQVIPAWSDNVAPEPAIQPVVVGPSPSNPGVSEGGSIPIHAIFADFRKDSHLASAAKTASTTARETSVDSPALARRTLTPDNAIAGEWARAMVFEIAGGEPTASDSHRPADTGESLQHSEPLSSVEQLQQNPKTANSHSAALPSEGSPVGEPAQPPAAQANEQIAAIVTQLMSDGKLAAANGVGQSSVGYAAGAQNPDAAALAAAAVFDQLGEGNAAVIESRVDGNSWLRSIGTSPLLMVLALERIAALNSRRATRESRIAPTKKPIRARS